MNMIKTRKTSLFTALLFVPSPPLLAAELSDVEQLFKQKRSLCHAVDKKELGPAINTMSKNVELLRQVIAKGKNAMPGYEGTLTNAEIDALVDYLLANEEMVK